MGKYGFGSIYRRNKIWWVKWFVEGTPHYASSKSEKRADAVKLLKEKSTQKQEPKKVTVASLVDSAVEYYKEENPKSIEYAEAAAKALRAFFKGWLAADVTTEKLLAYRKKRAAMGKATATINRELAFLRLAFNRAAKTTPPKVIAVPKFPMVKENNARQGFIEPDQYARILAALPEEIKPLLVVAYHTGCRSGELLKLKWSMVDLDAGTIRLIDTKNGENRTLPIYGEMAPVLREHRSRTPASCPWVFHRRGAKVKDFRHAWRLAVEAAKLPGLLFHDLRRSAVRNMRRAGVSESVAMRISGHKTRAIFDRYDIVDERDLRDAGEKLGQFLKAKKDKK